MQEDNKEEFKRELINGWNHACSRLHDWFGNIYCEFRHGPPMGSAGWLIAMWVLTGRLR
jgi:hypothetical protein